MRLLKQSYLRPHQGAVNATRTFLSLPTCCLKVLSSNISTRLVRAFFVFGLRPVFSVIKLESLCRSRPLFYSVGFSLLPSIHFKVGNPVIVKFFPCSFF